MVDILKEAVALGESGTTILHQIEGTQLTKGRQQLLDLDKHKQAEINNTNAPHTSLSL